jgi:nitrogen fixation NifU-like protein
VSTHDNPLPGQVDQKFLTHAQFPRNLGVLSDATGQATEVGQCGDSVDVFIKVEGDTITKMKASPHGCLYTVVCASALGDLVQGRSLEQALQLEPEDVENELGGLPEDHKHCARLAVNTLGEAIADHYRRKGVQA